MERKRKVLFDWIYTIVSSCYNKTFSNIEKCLQNDRLFVNLFTLYESFTLYIYIYPNNWDNISARHWLSFLFVQRMLKA